MHVSISLKTHTNDDSNVSIKGGKILGSMGSVIFKHRTVLHRIKSNGQYKHWTTFSDGNDVTKTFNTKI